MPPTMTTQAGFAVASCLLALALALSSFERWLLRRRPHELAWAAGLALATVAAAALAWGAGVGWNGAAFRIFYLCGAVLDVPVLALGTVYLLARPGTARRAALVVALGAAFSAGVLVATALTASLPRHRLPPGSEVLPVVPRVLAGVASAGGALVLLGGATWSAWRARRTSAPRRRVVGNGLIATGTLVLGASGLLNSVVGEMTAFAVTLAAGLALLFAGFLVVTSEPSPDETAPAR
jgi:hypothetical protein